VPEQVKYREIFSSDYTEFGGTNVYNPEPLYPIHEPFGEASQHVLASIPPLGVIILKPEY